jgi:hypothetical protein
MALTNGKVADRFKAYESGKSVNMRTDGETLFSYDTPIACHVQTVDGTPITIINGDRHSSTSNRHVGALGWNYTNELPVVSFSALIGPGLASIRGLGGEIYRREVLVVAFEESLCRSAYEGQQDYDTILENVPIGATTWDFKSTGYGCDRIRASRGYHRAGTCVLRYRGYDYICGFDEGSYFVSRLPLQVKTVDMAYQVLMPKAVMGQQYLRQGEWFFVKAEQDALDVLVEQGERDAEDQYKRLTYGNRSLYLPGCEKVERYWRMIARRVSNSMGKKFTFGGFKRITQGTNHALPRSPGSNRHKVTYLYDNGVFLYAAGTIRHSQHRMLRLEPGVVYLAYRNNSLGDWSAQGRVD